MALYGRLGIDLNHPDPARNALTQFFKPFNAFKERIACGRRAKEMAGTLREKWEKRIDPSLARGIQCLIDAKADPNHTLNSGDTPFHHAMNTPMHHPDIVTQLLASQAVQLKQPIISAKILMPLSSNHTPQSIAQYAKKCLEVAKAIAQGWLKPLMGFQMRSIQGKPCIFELDSCQELKQGFEDLKIMHRKMKRQGTSVQACQEIANAIKGFKSLTLSPT